MARLGAKVTGIDASEKNIKIAKNHAERSNLNIDYINKSPEHLENSNEFDVILNLEIVEHVDNLNLYLESCSKLIKKKGYTIFCITFN